MENLSLSNKKRIAPKYTYMKYLLKTKFAPKKRAPK